MVGWLGSDAARRSSLSRDRVLLASVVFADAAFADAAFADAAFADAAFADAAGIDSLSLRNLARELGVVPMALYQHVANKQAHATRQILAASCGCP